MEGTCRQLRDLNVLFCLCSVIGWAAPLPSISLESGSLDKPAAIILNSGTKVELTLTIPVWADKAKPGDPIYTQTNFPVARNDGIVIPAGTWVQGKIESVTKPTRKSKSAELQILFNKIIFANGYTIALPGAMIALNGASGQNSIPTDAPTIDKVTVAVSTLNDLLLDNGAQIEMTLGAPLALDAAQVTSALPLSHAPEPGKFKSATLCRPTPGEAGTPGTSDTVIPGSPGTPSISIPGGPGMPDTVIPGTPPMPDTVIPGTPGSPGTSATVCPAAPIVISNVPVVSLPAQILRSEPATSH
ncbi:MAG: hypothetical protein ABR905_21955 [Terracidiphilus sp.]|jgi:hypothetical protein